MGRRYRPRKEFKFWLYHDITEELRLMDYIDYLQRSRQFARTIRNGLRLMWTLGQGDMSVLFELFPGIKASLAPVERQDIEELKRLIRENCSSQERPALNPVITTLLPAPVMVEDDEDTLVLKRTTSTDSTMNFLSNFANFSEG